MLRNSLPLFRTFVTVCMLECCSNDKCVKWICSNSQRSILKRQLVTAGPPATACRMSTTNQIIFYPGLITGGTKMEGDGELWKPFSLARTVQYDKEVRRIIWYLPLITHPVTNSGYWYFKPLFSQSPHVKSSTFGNGNIGAEIVFTP